jgi:hypothetical protein
MDEKLPYNGKERAYKLRRSCLGQEDGGQGRDT